VLYCALLLMMQHMLMPYVTFTWKGVPMLHLRGAALRIVPLPLYTFACSLWQFVPSPLDLELLVLVLRVMDKEL
jgi:hypothetical protein